MNTTLNAIELEVREDLTERLDIVHILNETLPSHEALVREANLEA